MSFKSGVKGRGSDRWWERRWWLWWVVVITEGYRRMPKDTESYRRLPKAGL